MRLPFDLDSFYFVDDDRCDVNKNHKRHKKYCDVSRQRRDPFDKLLCPTFISDLHFHIALLEKIVRAPCVRARKSAFLTTIRVVTVEWGRGRRNVSSPLYRYRSAYSPALDVEAVYVTAFDLISFIRSAFSQDRHTKVLDISDQNAYQRLQKFERVKVLALDEFDKVKVTDWVLEQLTDLIDRRYRMAEDNAGGTLIAMNDHPSLLPSWISSRLKRYTIIHNADDDMRPVISQSEMRFSATGEVLEEIDYGRSL